jgi:hypothetical protein
MRKASLAIFAAAMLAGTPPIDEMRREIRNEEKTHFAKNRAKIKAGRKQRQKHKK